VIHLIIALIATKSQLQDAFSVFIPYFSQVYASAVLPLKKRMRLLLHNQDVSPAMSISGRLTFHRTIGFIRVCTIFITPPQHEQVITARVFLSVCHWSGLNLSKEINWDRHQL
jgi:hypothetical protein